MSNVIKAGDRRGARGAKLNLDDVSSQAAGCLDKARSEAARILEQANCDAAMLRRQSEAEGLCAAQQKIERLLDERLQARLESVLPAVRQAADELRRVQQAWLAQGEQQAVRLAVAIAQRVIRRELRTSLDVPLELVREALQLAAGSGRMRVLMNPADVKALGDEVKGLIAAAGPAGSVELIALESISPGGCRVDTDFGSIDQQIGAQLRRIEEELV